ncbi:hypothetical protein NW759_016673 [Fusarium solani]|nr:hypothetical protein NW759_016673 [Fusarium solani]
MAIIAIAGGTGGVGKTIVEQARLNDKHEIFVPSSAGPDFIQVWYDDVHALTKSLEDYNVDTVISTINLQSEAASQAQLNLIEAADKSKTTKRFIPSEFAFVPSEDDAESEPSVAFALKSVNALRSSSLQFTRFANGFFMDYWGMPNIPSNLWPYTWAIDVANRRAAIPGTGNDVLSLTYSVDVAKFVIRCLDADEWPEISILAGSDITFNELLAIAEKIQGTGSKFDVTYDSVETLQKDEPTLLSSEYGGGGGAFETEAKQMVALFGRMTIAGNFRLPAENRINENFPDLHALTAEELLTKAWGGR